MARRIHTARRTDPLPRAVGLHKRHTVNVVDATAGLGRDSMVLAHLGCSVIAVEQIPALCALVQLAVEDLGAQIEVVMDDAIAWLEANPDRAPEVVYLDPMFAEPSKSQVKKEMQACRILAGNPVAEQKLLEVARAVARDRVVVKRHPHHAPIAPGMSHTVESGRIRFDVYLTPT
jgi:16S rRNA (guanine1516-N2)-methyltransferase